MVKRNWSESLVKRDRDGKFSRVESGRARRAEIAATGRAKNDLEDRSDERLRWGSKGVKNVWYLITGPRYWIPQGKEPAWHRNHYYVPGRPWPVVPPRDTWPSARSYNGIPGQSSLSHLVPDDVLAAAGFENAGATDEPSARVDAHKARRSVKEGTGDMRPRAGRKVTTITRRKTK